MANDTKTKLEQLFQEVARLTPEEAKIAANVSKAGQVSRPDKAGWPSNLDDDFKRW